MFSNLSACLQNTASTFLAFQLAAFLVQLQIPSEMKLRCLCQQNGMVPLPEQDMSDFWKVAKEFHRCPNPQAMLQRRTDLHFCVRETTPERLFSFLYLDR
uniref:AlNc14C68G4783 protein n=1 Tax=Albugo laibachii Nc14 TaxID=890382 RepID=F0WDR4_9STRA|nr:AlNc14C68G4783 [Albugo laibachii Nc14]|eukprot:CCA19341.1 AlNc14C68G4783 [Albugo laibachii Nc14]